MDLARYWQEPDGADVLAATDAVRGALRRVAEHVAQSPWTEWWSADAALNEQWAVGWSFGDADLLDDSAVGRPAAEVLSEWSVRTAVEEERALRERPTDPTASVGGEWWSTPPTLCSSRLLADGTPAGLWFVEDSSDPPRAVSRRVTVAEGARVFEVDGPQATGVGAVVPAIFARGDGAEATRVVPHHRSGGQVGHPGLVAGGRSVRRRPPHRSGIPVRCDDGDSGRRRLCERHRRVGTGRDVLVHRRGEDRRRRCPPVGE